MSNLLTKERLAPSITWIVCPDYVDRFRSADPTYDCVMNTVDSGETDTVAKEELPRMRYVV